MLQELLIASILLKNLFSFDTSAYDMMKRPRGHLFWIVLVWFVVFERGYFLVYGSYFTHQKLKKQGRPPFLKS